MSAFSDVDASRDPSALVSRLDELDRGLSAMKSYVAAAARRAVRPGGLVLDLGCGGGHDLERLAGAGLAPIGVDPSRVMVGAARRRVGGDAALLRADGGALPFATGALDGCRIERVLQHVADPAAVLGEAARVLRPGGWLAVFEPDWTTVRIIGLEADLLGSVVTDVRHPAIGRRLVELVGVAGFEVDDEVVERSRASRVAGLPWPIDALLDRAVQAGRIDRVTATSWCREIRRRDHTGTFDARWEKVLVVATRR